MLRKLSIVPIFLAMMMMTLATVLPHHHHQTMICIVEEVCGMDGCCDDEHTHHSDTNHNQDESHCVAHKQYCPSERLHIDNQDFGIDAGDIFPILAILSNLPSHPKAPLMNMLPGISYHLSHRHWSLQWLPTPRPSLRNIQSTILVPHQVR